MVRVWLFVVLLGLGTIAPMLSRSAESDSSGIFEPQTVMLSHFTLTRPEHWHWVSTSPREGNVLMEVIYSAKNPENENSPAMIYFNHTKPDAAIATVEATEKRWKGWFKEVRTATPFSEPKSIGAHKVCFVEFTGNYEGPTAAGRKPKQHPNYTLFGAHIEDKDGNVLVRLIGPTKLVEQNKPAFNAMLDQALESK